MREHRVFAVPSLVSRGCAVMEVTDDDLLRSSLSVLWKSIISISASIECPKLELVGSSRSLSLGLSPLLLLRH